MSEFKQVSSVLKRRFTKRTLYAHDQYYELEVVKINDDDISIEIVSSQTTKCYISGTKELIQKIVKDLNEVIKL